VLPNYIIVAGGLVATAKYVNVVESFQFVNGSFVTALERPLLVARGGGSACGGAIGGTYTFFRVGHILSVLGVTLCILELNAVLFARRCRCWHDCEYQHASELGWLLLLRRHTHSRSCDTTPAYLYCVELFFPATDAPSCDHHCPTIDPSPILQCPNDSAGVHFACSYYYYRTFSFAWNAGAYLLAAGSDECPVSERYRLLFFEAILRDG
jgi:hypothetical protein